MVASSNQVDIYYYQDEPGRVPAVVTGAGDDGEQVGDSGSDRQTTASGSSCKSEAGKVTLMFLPHLLLGNIFKSALNKNVTFFNQT